MRLPVIFLILSTGAFAGWEERFQAGENLLNQGRPDDAIRELRLALDEEPEKVAILDALGRAELKAGRYRAAKGYFERGLRQEKGDSIVATNLAMASIALGDYRRAEQLLREVLTGTPDRPIPRRTLAQALYRQGRRDEAAAILERLVNEGRDPAARADLALIYEERRQPEKAMALISEAIAEAQPGQSRARLLVNLGVLQWKTGAGKESSATLEKALREIEASVGNEHPDTAWILEQYGQVLRLMGRKEEARIIHARAGQIRSAFAVQSNENRHTVDWRDAGRR